MDQMTRPLTALAVDINQLYAQGELLSRQTTETFMEAGKLLNTARTRFTNNVAFGRWRSKSINFSQSHVQRLMQVAKEFGDLERATFVPFGTLAVLTTATPELMDQVLTESVAGNPPTRAQVIDRKKQAMPVEDERTLNSEDKRRIKQMAREISVLTGIPHTVRYVALPGDEAQNPQGIEVVPAHMLN